MDWLAFLLLSALAAGAPAAGDEQPPIEQALREEVVVSASVEGETVAPLGASATVVHPERAIGTPAALSELVQAVPGVSENGQGGLFQVISVRGVSRQRVSNRIADMRLSSERRAGVSASFVDPLLMGSVQVVRGPSTTVHGSGALGGLVQILPKRFDGPVLETGFSSNGSESYQALGLDVSGWSVGLAHRQAQDAESADGERLSSHFNQVSAVVQRFWERGGREYELMFIPTYGEDIGKANTDFPERTTEYPLERHQLMRFGVRSARGWESHAYFHAQDLETEIVGADGSLTRVVNDAFDFGASWKQEREIGPGLSTRYGIDAYSRRGVDAEETDATGTDRTLDGARSDEAGGFGLLHWTTGEVAWETGIRLSWSRRDNRGGPERDQTTLDGHAGAEWTATSKLRLRGSLSSGLRLPGLSELYFSGTTARGSTIGNPELDAERSFNTELGVDWLGRRLLGGVLVFHNRIDDYIERIEPRTDEYTFVNRTSGTIEGIEVHGLFIPADDWRFFWSAHAFEGRDGAGEPLADIPPDEVELGGGYHRGPWRFETRLAHRSDKNDGGSGESRSIPSAWLWSAEVNRTLSPRWSLGIGAENMLDEDYFRSADRKAPPAMGRSVSIRVAWKGD